MPAIPLLALFPEALEGAEHELALEGCEVVDEELAVQVVDLMLQDTGVEAEDWVMRGLIRPRGGLPSSWEETSTMITRLATPI